MSGIPPQLDAEPGTPAREWAAKTASALDPSLTKTTTFTTTSKPAGTVMTEPVGTSMNPTTRQMFEEKNMRPGTIAPETFSMSNTIPPSVTTPGYEVPGAYPSNEDTTAHGESITNTAVNTAQRVAESVSNGASTYLPAAAHTAAQYLPKSFVDSVSAYMPGASNPQDEAVMASEHDKLHKKSLPSTELTGQRNREYTEGVGSLPGPIVESEVAKLPDERNATIPTAEGATAIAKDTVHGAAQTAYSAKDRVAQAAPFAFGAAGGANTSLPTSEKLGQQPYEHSGGVGALPGNLNEPAVATLPDQNPRGSTAATSASVGTHGRTFDTTTLPSQEHDIGVGGSVSGGVGALPGKAGEEGVAILPDERGGSGKWEHDDSRNPGMNQRKIEARPLADPKIGETAVLADRARAAGAEKHEAMGNTSSKDTAASVGAPTTVKTDTGPSTGATTPKESAGTWDTHVHSKATQRTGDAAGAAAIGSAVGKREMEKKDEKQDQKQAQKQEQKQEKPKAENQGKPNEGGGYDTDYHPSQLHPANADYSKEQAQSDDNNEEPLTGAKHADSTGSATDHDDDSSSHGQKTKKAGFMQKMKGEAMVLLGKAEGKKGHDKVEEGQRIKSGQAASH
ncbi:hypothetical protein EW026_g4811 [Hermanssonia centrifuga]|uniref:Uncharacterized protein n=1 Tax=Hermanssonia centrifuga TaxID=98765 RepID=A0A4S4KG09_9APHY|nr:hypothetical protein EW026_g4811 [Hermanssonia centrifuga]